MTSPLSRTVPARSTRRGAFAALTARSAAALGFAGSAFAAPHPAGAHAEKMPTPKFLLRHEPLALEVTVLSVEEKDGPHAGTSVWHRVRVDRIEHGEAPPDVLAGVFVAAA